MKLIIAGSRNFNNYDLLKSKVDDLLSEVRQPVEEIVSGGAFGADKLGERYAVESGYEIKQFLPNWDKLGKAAGYVRNREMAMYSTHCLCFWDGKSKGTKMMIDLAITKGLFTRVVNF